MVVIICQSPALAVQRSQRSFRCCLVTLGSCGVATRPAVDRDPKTRTRNAIAPACCRSVPFNMFKALVVLLNVLRAAITELPTHLAVVDQRNCGRDAPPKWNLPATTRLQQVGARLGDENCLRATSWRTRSHCCPCSTSELTANFFWASAVVAVDRLPRSMMLQFSFVFVHAYGVRRHYAYVRRHFVPMVPPAVITIRMRTL